MNDWIDAHHHLWDLDAVNYPWLMESGVARFFGDPTPIQRDYLLDEFRQDATQMGVTASVHIQVGAKDGLTEAKWVQRVAEANPDWPIAQVVFCDLTLSDLEERLDAFEALTTVRGVRQIVGRAPGEDAVTGTNSLLDNPRFADGLRQAGIRGFSFDLQLLPELMEKSSAVLERAPETKVALCHAGSPHDRSAKGLREWEKQLRHLSALPQVSCKLSGLGMFKHDWRIEDFQPIVEICLDQFGPERCMFGSNFPVDSLYSDYATLAETHQAIVPEAFRSQVFRQTAADFYSL